MSEKPKRSDNKEKKPSIHSKRKIKPDGTKEPRMRKRSESDFAPERSFSRTSDSRPKGSRFGNKDGDNSERRFVKPGNSYRDSRASDSERSGAFKPREEKPRRRSFDDKSDKEERGSNKNFDFRKSVSRSGSDQDRPPRRAFKDSVSREGRDSKKEGDFKPRSSKDSSYKDRPARNSDRKEVDFNKRSNQSDSRERRPFKREEESKSGKRPFKVERSERSSGDKPAFGLRSSRGNQDKSFDQASRGKSREGDFKKGFTRRNSIKEENPMFKVTRAKGKERELVWGDTGEETSSTPVKKSYRDEKVVRLNRYIANAGICSRREADTLILAGTVTINGKVVTELGTKVNPDDVVLYGGQKISREKLVYVLLNKPKDYVTTMRDPQGRKTVDQLIRGACRERIVPVGRLDRDTSGLLLMTNDGDMAKKLTHPKHGVVKLYHVHTDKKVSPEHIRQLMEGITLEDGPAKADQVAFVGDTQREVGLEIHIGRNRIVRRMFESLGYKVVKLDRVIFAGLTKKDLPRGRWRYLTEMELNKLKMVQ